MFVCDFPRLFCSQFVSFEPRCVCAEPQSLDAVALYDFESRTGQELSFKKGDLLVLKRRISEDWWEGLHGNQLGLVPTKYVATDAKRCERIFCHHLDHIWC